MTKKRSWCWMFAASFALMGIPNAPATAQGLVEYLAADKSLWILIREAFLPPVQDLQNFEILREVTVECEEGNRCISEAEAAVDGTHLKYVVNLELTNDQTGELTVAAECIGPLCFRQSPVDIHGHLSTEDFVDRIPPMQNRISTQPTLTTITVYTIETLATVMSFDVVQGRGVNVATGFSTLTNMDTQVLRAQAVSQFNEGLRGAVVQVKEFHEGGDLVQSCTGDVIKLAPNIERLVMNCIDTVTNAPNP